MNTPKLLAALAASCLIAASAVAGTTNSVGIYVISNAPPTVQLTWDASPSTNVAGYNLYYGGASTTYTNMTSLGNVLTAKVTGLVPGATYYFAVTAVDSAGLESVFSNEVSWIAPTPPAPPGMQKVVTLTAQSADWIWGPWTDVQSWQIGIEALSQFWRLQVAQGE